jgi:pimeloyl-ACP methyl ester carboxylesterase
MDSQQPDWEAVMTTTTEQHVATEYVERDGGLIAYDDTHSSGPLVVAVPGMGDLRQEYRFMAPRLVEAGFRVVTMDLRGHGESSIGWASYTPEDAADDIAALIESLGGGKAVLVGTSWAAAAIAIAAAERPDLVAGLIMAGPFVRDVPISKMQALMLKVLLVRPWGPWAWAMYYNSLYPTHKPDGLDAYRKALKANLSERGRFEALKAVAAAPKDGAWKRLGGLSVPTLVLMGTKDPDHKDPEAEAKLIADRTHGSYTMLEGAGHYPHAEMPNEAVARIVAFLRNEAFPGT